jgi:uncharacterized membrane protein
MVASPVELNDPEPRSDQMDQPRRPDHVARLLFLSPLLLIGVGVLASVLALPHLPERMPIHWGMDGQATRLASRAAAAVLMIVFMVHAWLTVGLIGWAVTRDKLSPRVMAGITAAVVAFLLLMHLSMLASGLGWNLPVPLAASVGAGLLFVVMGHKMRSVPPNPVFGVRTAATMRSPAAWRRANDVGGRWFVYAGVATLLAAPLPPPWPIAVLLGAITVAAVAGMLAGRRAVAGEEELG